MMSLGYGAFCGKLLKHSNGKMRKGTQHPKVSLNVKNWTPFWRGMFDFGTSSLSSYTPLNEHSNGTSPFSIEDPSSSDGFSSQLCYFTTGYRSYELRRCGLPFLEETLWQQNYQKSIQVSEFQDKTHLSEPKRPPLHHVSVRVAGF